MSESVNQPLQAAGYKEGVVLDRAGLDNLLQALQGLGYQVMGPTMRDGAIVYDRVETIADLNEIDVGVASGKPFDELRGLPGASDDGFRKWPGGESLEAVHARALPAIDRLVAESPGKTICVVGHGGVTRILVSGFMGVLPKLIRVPATNTNITIVTHDPQQGYVVQEMFKDTHVAEGA